MSHLKASINVMSHLEASVNVMSHFSEFSQETPIEAKRDEPFFSSHQCDESSQGFHQRDESSQSFHQRDEQFFLSLVKKRQLRPNAMSHFFLTST